MSARDALFWDIWDNRTAEEKNALIDAHRDEVALEIGRDALRDGLIPTLTRLVGDANATKLMADFRDAFAHQLAEQLRDERPQHNPDWQCWGDAADLVDPLKDAT